MPVILPNSIFYHIPKTGGTWVTNTLLEGSNLPAENYRVEFSHPENLSSEHASISHIPKNKRKDKFSYAFVRNPYEWYRSIWAFREESEWPDPDRFILDRECRSCFFDVFIKKVHVWFPNGYLTKMYQEYVGKELELIDFIGKVEFLREDLKTVLKTADEDFDFDLIDTRKKENVTHRDIKKRAFLDDETKKLIRHMDSWVFDKFDYD